MRRNIRLPKRRTKFAWLPLKAQDPVYVNPQMVWLERVDVGVSRFGRRIYYIRNKGK